MKAAATTNLATNSTRAYVLRRSEFNRHETIASGTLDEMIDFLHSCITDRCRPKCFPNRYTVREITSSCLIKLSRNDTISDATDCSTELTYRIANNDTDYSSLSRDDYEKVYNSLITHRCVSHLANKRV